MIYTSAGPKKKHEKKSETGWVDTSYVRMKYYWPIPDGKIL